MEYLLIVGVCFIVLYRSLWYGIVVDDIYNRTKWDKTSTILLYKRNIFSRIRYALNGEFPVKSIKLDHLITIILHTSVCCLIYYVFHNLPAALLFSVNVSNNQSSLWLNGKRYAVNAILCLLAFLLGDFGVVFFVMTSIFQISAVSFPVIMLLSGSFLYFAAIPILFLLRRGRLKEWVINKFRRCNVDDFKNWDNRKIILYFKTIAFYFIRGIFPYAPTMYPEQFKMFGLKQEDTEEAYRFDAQAFAGVCIVILALYGYCVNKELFFGIVWWLVTISVFGNLITLTVPLAERYMYLPNIGLMLFITSLLTFIDSNVWCVVMAFYASRFWTFMPMYRNFDEYFKHHCFYYPNNDQCWIFRANKSAENNDICGVMYLSNAGLISNPKSALLWLHRAGGFIYMRNKDLAMQCIEKAIENATGAYHMVVENKINDIHRKFKEVFNE